MPFSAIDFATLSAHRFFNVYDVYRDRLLAHARYLYQRLKQGSIILPSITDCELFFEFELPATVVFADLVADLSAGIPFPKPTDAYWELFCCRSGRALRDRQRMVGDYNLYHL
jgi:hypothetical protein